MSSYPKVSNIAGPGLRIVLPALSVTHPPEGNPCRLRSERTILKPPATKEVLG